MESSSSSPSPSSSVSSSLHYWLVEHPVVREFEWKKGITFGSSPLFLSLTVFTYLSLTFFLSRFKFKSLSLPSSSPLLRLISTVHNLFILFLSLIMAVGCLFSSLHQMPHARWILCFPANQTPPRGPIFFWGYIFYLSKIIEFVDTLLIIVNREGNRRLSFLHVYHHAVVVVMCYVWLNTAQSLFPIGLVTNASVHTLMYAYYLCCGVGYRWGPSGKRLVTDCQIIQFVFGFVLSPLMLYMHFVGGGGCSGIWGWCFNCVFNLSLLALFLNFHTKNYGNGNGNGKKDKRL